MTSEPDWIRHFPALRSVVDEAGQRALATAHITLFPPTTTLFTTGSACKNYLLIITGRVRVQPLSVSGREIVLYRIGPGESCILTATCLLAHSPYVAEGVTEIPVLAVLLPAAAFQVVLAHSGNLRHFVFSTYGERLSALLRLLEEIAFERMDVRLAKRLLDLGCGRTEIMITHGALAIELGSAREVITRILKLFTTRGWVRVHRGRVEIINRQALRILAESGSSP